MNTPQSEPQPVDLIINRYLPNASQEEREKAREDLQNFTRALLKIATRRALEERGKLMLAELEAFRPDGECADDGQQSQRKRTKGLLKYRAVIKQ